MVRHGTLFRSAGAAILLLGLMSCGDDRDHAALPSQAAVSEGSAGDSFPLPFGLVQLDGTVSIGRPVVYDHDRGTFNDAPVRVRSLRAAYRVPAADAVAVFREWVGQLDGLALDEVCVRAGGAGTGAPEPWVRATNCDDSGGDHADLQLWATSSEPILLVSLDRTGDAPPRAPEVRDDAGAAAAPGSVVDESERVAGDRLFSEQGDVVHLPDGTRALMPTIPTFGGTGGSTSVLAAEDGEAAVRAMLDEVMAVSDHAEVTGPVTAHVDGTRVVNASSVITAGGWELDVVAAQGLGDTYATVHVVSGAD